MPIEKTNDTPAGLQIGNTPGQALPSTGGHGTTPIYLLGTLLTILASVGLLMRKRNMAL